MKRKMFKNETTVESRTSIKQKMLKSSKYTIFSLTSTIKILILTFSINKINKFINIKVKKI